MANRLSTISLALAGFLLPCLTILADPPKPREQGGNTEIWIKELEADDWKVRQQAHDKLVDQGEEVVPRLRKLLDTTTDSEVRTRVDSAIMQIEQNRIVGKSLITMNLSNVSAAQALAELARQARGPIPTDPSNLLAKSTRRVSLKVDHKPFWEVMQLFSAQTELEVTTVSRHGRESGLGLTQGGVDWMDRPIALAGPLLIRADRLTRISTARLKPPAGESEEFNISLTVFAEPKLKVLDYSGSLRLKEVTDNKGNSLVPGAADGLANVDVFGNARDGGTSRWEVGATLHRPKGAGKQISRLSASIVMQVQMKSAVLEIPMGAKNLVRTAGSLRTLVKTLDSSRCEMSVYRDGRNENDWSTVKMQLFAGEARLMDEQGRVLARSQSGVDADDSADGQRLDLKLRFTRDAAEEGGRANKTRNSVEPTRCVWEFPTEVRELAIPFEFRDLPIP